MNPFTCSVLIQKEELINFILLRNKNIWGPPSQDLWLHLQETLLHKLEWANSWRIFFWERTRSLLDLWGTRGFQGFFLERQGERENEEQDRRKEGHAISRHVCSVWDIPKLTDICVPEHGVFLVPNVLEELHDPVADVLYLAEVRLYGNSRYNDAINLRMNHKTVTVSCIFCSFVHFMFMLLSSF